MKTAWVLTSAMPPTKGHANVIEFARGLPVGRVQVLQVSRVNESMRAQRLEALITHFRADEDVHVSGLYLDSPGPETDDYWVQVLQDQDLGFQEGDYLAASEHWGHYIATNAGGDFTPYDYAREIQYTRATEVRDGLFEEWHQILPSFQKMLQKRVVIFGAESVGKTTLAHDLARAIPTSAATVEFARPYLETVGGELTVEKMETIAAGQGALQRSLDALDPVPSLVLLDTDLYSTLGYWEFWSPETVPESLPGLAGNLKADLYLLAPANIPFEADALRYGGARREQPDAYWEDFLRRHQLPYRVIESQTREDRVAEALEVVVSLLPSLMFERQDNQ